MKKPRRPGNGKPVFHVSGTPRKVIGIGTLVHVKKIADSVPPKETLHETSLARNKKIREVTGYTLEDFVTAHGKPDIVGSQGFMSWEPETVKEKGVAKRIIFVGGVAVPKQHRRKGNRVELHNGLLKKIYLKYGLLVHDGLFIQTQISASDNQALETLTIRLGYAIFGRVRTGKQEIIILRKQLDSKEMNKMLS